MLALKLAHLCTNALLRPGPDRSHCSLSPAYLTPESLNIPLLRMSTSYGTRQGCTEVHQADLHLPISRYMLQQPALGTATSLIHHIGTNVVEQFGGSWAASGIHKRCQTFPSHVYQCPSGLSMLHELEAASKLVSKRFYRKRGELCVQTVLAISFGWCASSLPHHTSAPKPLVCPVCSLFTNSMP